jgi:hypothetical protein
MFAFALADRWAMPVRELLARVDSRELTRWMAWEKVRPPSREEILHAELMHWLGCLWLKNPKPFEQFLPDRLKPDPVPMTPGEIKSRLGSLFCRA